jgi:hypothetical protein
VRLPCLSGRHGLARPKERAEYAALNVWVQVGFRLFDGEKSVTPIPLGYLLIELERLER